MADDGLLSQEDINAALAAAGLEAQDQSSAPASSSPGASDSASAGVDQAVIDATLAEAAGVLEPDTPAGAGASGPAADSRVDSAGRSFDEVAAAMAAAIEDEKAPASAVPPPATSASPPSGARHLDIPDLSPRLVGASHDLQGIELLRDVELDVKIELGRSRMLVDQVLRLGEGSVVELDKLAGDPVDVFVNNRLVARGEVLVLNDNFCVRINDIVTQDDEDE